jgi:predicted  nucleic acid-binding Zn-ribbon protein
MASIIHKSAGMTRAEAAQQAASTSWQKAAAVEVLIPGREPMTITRDPESGVMTINPHQHPTSAGPLEESSKSGILRERDAGTLQTSARARGETEYDSFIVSLSRAETERLGPDDLEKMRQTIVAGLRAHPAGESGQRTAIVTPWHSDTGEAHFMVQLHRFAVDREQGRASTIIDMGRNSESQAQFEIINASLRAQKLPELGDWISPKGNSIFAGREAADDRREARAEAVSAIEAAGGRPALEDAAPAAQRRALDPDEQRVMRHREQRQKELERVQRQLTELQEQTSTLAAEIADADHALEALTQAREARAQAEAAREAQAAAEQQAAAEAEARAAADAAREQATAEAEALRTEIGAVRDENVELRDGLAQRQAEADELRAEVDGLTEAIESERQISNDFKELAQKEREERNRIALERDDLTHRLEAETAEKNAQFEARTAAEAARDDLSHRFDALSVENKSLVDQVADLGQRLETAEARASAAEQQAQQEREQREQLSRDLADVRQRLDAEIQKNQGFTAEMADLTRDRDALRQRLDAAEQRTATAENALSQAREAEALARGEVTALRSVLDRWQEPARPARGFARYQQPEDIAPAGEPAPEDQAPGAEPEQQQQPAEQPRQAEPAQREQPEAGAVAAAVAPEDWETPSFERLSELWAAQKIGSEMRLDADPPHLFVAGKGFELEDTGRAMKITAGELPADVMVAAAKDREWPSINITSGNKQWKAQVWQAAKLAGMEVTGYEPTEAQRAAVEAELARREAQRGGLEQAPAEQPAEPEAEAAPVTLKIRTADKIDPIAVVEHARSGDGMTERLHAHIESAELSDDETAAVLRLKDGSTVVAGGYEITARGGSGQPPAAVAAMIARTESPSGAELTEGAAAMRRTAWRSAIAATGYELRGHEMSGADKQWLEKRNIEQEKTNKIDGNDDVGPQ